MYTTTTGPPPSFEVETVERFGEQYELTTRVRIEGLTATHVAQAIAEAVRVVRLATERENDR